LFFWIHRADTVLLPMGGFGPIESAWTETAVHAWFFNLLVWEFETSGPIGLDIKRFADQPGAVNEFVRSSGSGNKGKQAARAKTFGGLLPLSDAIIDMTKHLEGL
jgi:hypothetical protein